MFSVGLDVDKIVFTELYLFIKSLINFNNSFELGEWEKILLYAGNSCLSSPLGLTSLGKIYLLAPRVASLGQSAGNFSTLFFSKKRVVAPTTDIKIRSYIGINLPKISEHVPKHKSNLSDNDFGYFLAGLIEGDGCLELNNIYINFSEKDVSLAYLIKKRIGYGKVLKKKDGVRYICSNKTGVSTILNLINGKLVSFSSSTSGARLLKYTEMIKDNILCLNKTFVKFEGLVPPSINVSRGTLSLDNYWLAGFTQANGSFQIKILDSQTDTNETSILLEFSLKQTDSIVVAEPLPLLKLFYEIIKCGNLSEYDNGVWCYKSNDYNTAFTLIKYFDKYNLFASKYVNYLKFRKVYIMITEGKHLDSKGIAKIKSIRPKE